MRGIVAAAAAAARSIIGSGSAWHGISAAAAALKNVKRGIAWRKRAADNVNMA